MLQAAVQSADSGQVAAAPPDAEAEASLKALQLLLPPRSYLGTMLHFSSYATLIRTVEATSLPPCAGGASGEAAELAAEERVVLSSISGLIDALQKEKEALLVSCSTQQVQHSQPPTLLA